MLKRIRYFIEGLVVKTTLWLTGLLPLRTASALGGFTGRLLAPVLSRNKIARKNLKRAMPEKNDAQIDKIIEGMWENLGRVYAEFPHVGKLKAYECKDILSLEGVEHLETIKKINKGAIFISGHLANWEMGPKLLTIHGFPLNLVYRKGNNPALDDIIQRSRNLYQSASIPKGNIGTKLLVQSIKEGKHVGVLIDQKINNGIPVKFFNDEAMTVTVIAKLALKFNCPLLPTRVMRTNGPAHKVTIYPPIEIVKTDNLKTDVLNIMTRLNSCLEEWIKDKPEQWIWVHNRWPKNANE